MSDEIKNLCLELAYSNSEKGIIEVLSKLGYWGDDSVWQHYGGNENNFSTIGNQQSTAEAALVEKIINSVDAVLMRECLKRSVKPDGPDAPKSLALALQGFFGILNGKLTNLDIGARAKLAENIMLVASGDRSNPSYSVIDNGEGQSPSRLPTTFLSLSRSNKLRIPFVQGKFNMGGTGSLQFCGKRNIQLIISKRNPDVASLEDNDPTVGYWGLTVVRREDPRDGLRSSVFKYLAPNKEILKFKADMIPLLPKEYPSPYGGAMRWGSFVKLYEYQLKGLKSPVQFDLYYKLSLLLPSLGLPVTLYERRKGYTSHQPQIVLSGLSVRLDEDKRNNLEPGFPSSSEITVQGEKMHVLKYAFKKDQIERYAPREGVIFVINGQAHGFLPRTFFERKSVGMAYLKDSILVMVGCSEFRGRTREDLFMNSRDRLREGDLKSDIEDQLSDLIKNDEGLRALREKRRREELESILQDSKPLTDVLNNIIKKSPSLSKLLIQGVVLRDPFNLSSVGSQKEFKGKKYPTYFKLRREYPSNKPKPCPINRRFRVQFETDAENDYFDRENDTGSFKIALYNKGLEDYSLNLWNGVATLNVALPNRINIGDKLAFETDVEDPSRAEPLSNDFYIMICKPDQSNGGRGGRTPPSSDMEGDERDKAAGLSLPNIKECRKSDSDNYEFKNDEEGALIIKDSGESGYDFYINMDNVFLKTELKGSITSDPKIMEARFKYGMVLIGLSSLNAFEKIKDCDTDEIRNGSVYERIYFFAKAVSPVILPMISSLSEIQIE